jgi:hypothetical protein
VTGLQTTANAITPGIVICEQSHRAVGQQLLERRADLRFNVSAPLSTANVTASGAMASISIISSNIRDVRCSSYALHTHVFISDD